MIRTQEMKARKYIPYASSRYMQYTFRGHATSSQSFIVADYDG